MNMTITHRSQDTGWNQRYGDPHDDLPPVPDSVRVQLAHRSVRRFLPDEVSEGDLRTLVAAAQSAPTSSNLQPWSVVAVRDPDAPEAVDARGAAGVRGAGAAPPRLGRRPRPRPSPRRARRRASSRPPTTWRPPSSASSTWRSPPRTPSSRPRPSAWARATSGRSATTPRRWRPSSACPPHAVAAFGLAVGRPDPTEHAGVKPRLPQQAVLHHEQYDAARADAHLGGVRREAGRLQHAATDSPAAWTDRVLTRLAGPESMAGRHRLREALERLGLPVR